MLIPTLDGPMEGGGLDAASYAEAVQRAHARYPALASFAATLGNTPLVSLPSPRGAARIIAKLESANPAGSIKDRVAHGMLSVRLARATGIRRVIEYSGGNLAVSLSRLCSDLRVPLTLVLSSGSPASLVSRMAADGTEVVLVDRRAGFRAVIETASRLAAEDPEADYLYQHHNAVNALIHEHTTAAELLRQAHAVPAAWVASIGTGGTLIGVARAIRAANPTALVVGATPAEMPFGTEGHPDGRPRYAGSGGLGLGTRQPIVAADDLVDEHETVPYDQALAAMGRLRELTGLRVGSSAAANWVVSQRVAVRLGPDATVATVVPCAGTPEEWEQVR